MSVDVFQAERARLLGLAYRMLGSRTEAEDIVQDAFVRWTSAADYARDAKALLTTIVTRLSLDRLKSARMQREVYVGTWLPEPVCDTDTLRPDVATELADDLSFALLLTLERLSPLERATFLLHDVFGQPFSAIAVTLERSEDACRQLAARARKAVRERQSKPVPAEKHMALVAAWLAAVAAGDEKALRDLLHTDAVLLSDGGGRRSAALNPIRSADHVARLCLGLARKALPQLTAARFAPMIVNGAVSLALYDGVILDQIIAFEADDDRLLTIYILRNPEKLKAMTG